MEKILNKRWKYNAQERHNPMWVAIVTHNIFFFNFSLPLDLFIYDLII